MTTPQQFTPDRAWRARRGAVLALLFAPLALRVPWLELRWSATDRCRVTSGLVVEDDGGYHVKLHVTLDDPVCAIPIDATGPLPSREEAEERLGAWPKGSTLTCHRVPGLCGAGIERPHVAAPFWAIPLAWIAGIVVWLVRLRPERVRARAVAGGPFRRAGEDAMPARPPIEIRPKASGIGWRIAAGFFALLGLVGAVPMLVVFWLLPLNEIGYPIVVAVMAVLMSALLLRSLMGVWPRRRLVIAGDGRAAYLGSGIGPLEIWRTYASFERAPEVALEPEHANGRDGSGFVVGWRMVLGDGSGELAIVFDEEREARRAAELVREALAPQ